MEPSIVISDYGEAKNTADPCSTMRVGLTRPGQWYCEWAQLGPHSRDASGPGYARTVVMRVDVNKAM